MPKSKFSHRVIDRPRLRRGSAGLAAVCLMVASASPVLAGDNAVMPGASFTIAVGERATFPVQTHSELSTEFSGWCELKSAGSASVVFDGRHYIPLSHVINFNGPGERRFEMTGTFEASSGAASISFFFSGVPVAFCFGGGDCASVGEGSGSVAVSCGQY